MDSDKNYEVIDCPEDDENRVYCDICHILCIERFYKKPFETTNSILIIFAKEKN